MAHPPTYICEGVCGRTIRRSQYKPKDYPGTIGVYRQHKCYPCYMRPTGPYEPLPELFTCRGTCGRQLRRGGRLKADYPETVVAVANDMCAVCYAAHKAKHPSPPPEPSREDESVAQAVANNPALAAFHARMRRAGARHNRKKGTV